jgi:hypothetical protein
MDLFTIYGFKQPIYTYEIQKIIIQKYNYFHTFSKTNMKKAHVNVHFHVHLT